MDRAGLIAVVLSSAIAAGACAGHRPETPSLPMEAALERTGAANRAPLGDSLKTGLQGPGTFGTGQPAVPVVVPPDIRRVWVPTHENSEGELIAGHWVYLRVQDFRWLIESTPAGATGPTEIGRQLSPAPRGSTRSASQTSGIPWVEAPPPEASGSAPGAGGSGRPPASSPPPKPPAVPQPTPAPPPTRW